MEFISKWRKNKKEDLNILKVDPDKRTKGPNIEQPNDEQQVAKLKKSSHDLAEALKWSQSRTMTFYGVEKYVEALEKELIIKRFINDKKSVTGKILKQFIEKLKELLEYFQGDKNLSPSISKKINFKELEVKIRDLSDIYFEIEKSKSHFKAEATILNKEVLKTFDGVIIEIKKIFTSELNKLKENSECAEFSSGSYLINKAEKSEKSEKQVVKLAKQLKYELTNTESIEERIRLYKTYIKPTKPINSISQEILKEYCEKLDNVLQILDQTPLTKETLEEEIEKMKIWRTKFKNKSLPIIKKAHITPTLLKRPAYTVFILSMDEIINDIEAEYLSEAEIYMEENVDGKIKEEAMELAKKLKYKPREIHSLDEYDDQIQSYLNQIKSDKLKSCTNDILAPYCNMLKEILTKPLRSCTLTDLETYVNKLKQLNTEFKQTCSSVIKNNDVAPILIRPACTTFISSMEKIIKDIEFVKDNQYKNTILK